jgi:hypothetical protein
LANGLARRPRMVPLVRRPDRGPSAERGRNAVLVLYREWSSAPRRPHEHRQHAAVAAPPA